MNRRQKKKRGIAIRERPDSEACAGCYQQERYLEYGRGKCSQYKNLEAIKEEIKRVNAEMRMKGENVV